jgi:hypothetical protein
MRLNQKSGKLNQIEKIKSWIDFFRNIIYQISKIIRYFVDIQVSVIESTINGFWPTNYNQYKSFFLSKFYEQIYIFTQGSRIRTSIEYTKKVNEKNEIVKVIRNPLEINFGCDLFRVWLIFELLIDTKDVWNVGHNFNFAITLLDVYTLCNYTFNLIPFYKKLISFLKEKVFYFFKK